LSRLKPVHAFADRQKWAHKALHARGPAAAEIAQIAENDRDDLIVMGSHGPPRSASPAPPWLRNLASVGVAVGHGARQDGFTAAAGAAVPDAQVRRFCRQPAWLSSDALHPRRRFAGRIVMCNCDAARSHNGMQTAEKREADPWFHASFL